MKKIVIIIIGIIAIIAIGVGIILGMPQNLKAVEGNSDFGEYTGIYKLNNTEIKILHEDDTIDYKVYKDNDLYGNGSDTIKSNKIKIDDFTFEFGKNKMNVKSKNKNVSSGVYKRVDEYKTDNIYNDYVGDVALYNNNLAGVYENETYKIYIVVIDKNAIRMKYNTLDEGVNILVPKTNANSYEMDLFNTRYTINFKDNSLTLEVNSDDENSKVVNGTYTKTTTLSKVETIKEFNKD